MPIRKNRTSDLNDTTHLAGWVYADLLLGLMVVFLATITFRPLDDFANSDLVKSNYKQVDTGYNFSKGLSLVYAKFNLKAIKSDIESFKTKEKLSKNTQVVFTQVLAGYDHNSETLIDARNRALLIGFQLQSDPDNLLKDSEISVAESNSLKKNEFALRLTLVDKIK